jgi:hypothetical protein
VEELPIYVSLTKIQSQLRRDRFSAIIVTIGCSIVTYYFSAKDSWLLICGILMICSGIVIDYFLVEREIRKIKNEKKRVKVIPGFPR